MRKDKVVLSKEFYDKYQDRYYEQFSENKKLQRENGYLNALFDKEADTEIIKYNGKLYRITSTTNYVEAGVEETLDFTAVPVREVG